MIDKDDILAILCIFALIFTVGFVFWAIGQQPKDFYAIRITHKGSGIPNLSIQFIGPEAHAYLSSDKNGLVKITSDNFCCTTGYVFVFTYNGTTFQHDAVYNEVVEDPI